MTEYYIRNQQTRQWLYAGGINEKVEWRDKPDFAKRFSKSRAIAMIELIDKYALELIPTDAAEYVQNRDIEPIQFNLSSEIQEWICDRIECTNFHSPEPTFWFRTDDGPGSDYGPVTFYRALGHWVQPYRKIDAPVYLSPMDAFWGMKQIQDLYGKQQHEQH